MVSCQVPAIFEFLMLKEFLQHHLLEISEVEYQGKGCCPVQEQIGRFQ